MTRFFFDVRDGDYIPDQVGMELAGLSEARAQVVAFVDELLKESRRKFGRSDDWRVEVTDQNGVILFTLSVADPALLGFATRPSAPARWEQ